MKKVLFVCTGNTCRSPMAEALFNYYTRDIDTLTASSCGIYADGLSQISDNAKAVLKESGIDFSHTSVSVCKDIVKDADYIVGMSESHARRIITMFPEYSDKVYAMSEDIPDPYGGDRETYRKCRDEIEECVKMLIKTLLGEDNDKSQQE